ncbi:MAG TPA: hypothetical protein VK826_02360 [Bacteroidia bacterium]|nr:hypothetical protein [Bacteroidia bacterium]
MTITVFMMNEKFIVKFEAGPMEQVYKLSQGKVAGMEHVTKIVDEQFRSEVLKKFGEMFEQMRTALERNP